MAEAKGKGKKKLQTYLMIGGGAVLLLIFFMKNKSSGTMTATDLQSPVYMGTNPSSNGVPTAPSVPAGYTPPPATNTSYTDYSSQFSTIGQSLSLLGSQVADLKAKQATTPPPAPAPTIIGLQQAYQQYATTHSGASMENDAHLAGLHAQANAIRYSQISELQTNYMDYLKSHPGIDEKNTPYLQNLHNQAETLRSQLASG